MKTSLLLTTFLFVTAVVFAGQPHPFSSRQQPSEYLTKLEFTQQSAFQAEPFQINLVNNNQKVTTILRLINVPVLVGALLVSKENNGLRNGLLVTSIALSGAALYFQFHKRKANSPSVSLLERTL